MGAVRTTRVFMSGNSKAVRLPAGFALQAGQEVTVREEDGRCVIEPVADRKRTLDELYGAIPGLQPIPPEDREFEERQLDWHLLIPRRD